MRKHNVRKFGRPCGVKGFDSLAGQPLGKMFVIAMALGLLGSGLMMVLVPGEAGGDGSDDLLIELDGKYYYQGDEVTIKLIHTSQPCNGTILVYDPDGNPYLLETVPLKSEEDEEVNGLLAYWSFDEGSGQTVWDESGNGHDGTLGNSDGEDDHDPVWIDGISGKALEFDAKDEYVAVPYSPDLDLGSSYTVDVWVKFFHHDMMLFLDHPSGGWEFFWNDWEDMLVWNSDSLTRIIGKPWTPTINQWHHLAVTYNGTFAELFVDSVSLGSEKTDIHPVTTSGILKIGDDDDNDYHLKGKIDDVRIYNTALTAEEIASHYYEHSWKLNLTAHWKFDEGSGQIAGDDSGNSHDGTLGDSSGVDEHDPSWVDGIDGKALEFDGVDDYVIIPHHESFMFDSSYSLFAWIKPNRIDWNSTNEEAGYILGKTTTNNEWQVYIADGKLVSFYEYGSDVNGRLEADIPGSPIGKWVNIGITYDDETNLHSVYWNGELLESQIEVDDPEITYTGPVTIGAELDVEKDRYFDGTIDEIGVYSRALSADEIVAFYHEHSCKLNLTAHWTFDEGFGQTIKDSSGNDHDGTLGDSEEVDIHDPQWVEGISGTAAEFDGNKTFITIPHHNDFMFDNSYTISFWVNPDTMDYPENFPGRIINKAYTAREWGIHFDDNQIVSWYQYDEGGDRTEFLRATPPGNPIGQWSHVTITYDFMTKLHSIYWDGKILINHTTDSDPEITYSGAVGIGAEVEDPGRYFDGKIDELIVYNRALSSPEISVLYHDYISEVQTGTVIFTLPTDAQIGNWTVFATNDVDNSTANITFEVLPIQELRLVELDFTAEVHPGDMLHVDFVVLNGFNTEHAVLLALQLKDPSMRALRPDIKEKTINASTEKTWQLSVKIPKDAETGEYFLQGQMLTGWPDEGGYVLDYTTTSITVTTG